MVVAPGQGEVEVVATAIDLQFEIGDWVALPIRLPGFQSQTAIVTALAVT